MSSLLQRRLTSPRPLLDLLHFVGALAGILVVVHLSIMVNRGFDRGCFGFSAPTAQVECELVVASDAGTMLGVSNATWGLGFYLVLALLAALAGLRGTAESPVWRRLRAAALSGGVVYSAWLVYVQAAQLDAFCRLCLISAGIVTFLFVLVLIELATDPPTEPSVMRKPAFFAAFALATIVLVAADLSYFSGLDVADVAPRQAAVAADPGEPVPAVTDEAGTSDPVDEVAPPVSGGRVCEYDETIPEVEDYLSLITFSDPYMGASDAPVIVFEFFDPNCPHCRTLHPTMTALAESHGDLARIYPIPFMLWPDRSLLPIEALYVAAQDGKFHEMMDAQFAGSTGQGFFTVPQLQQMAVDIGLDPDKFMARLRQGLNRDAVWARRQQIAALGIDTTPTVMINGRVVRTKTATCLRQLIEEAAAR